MIKVVLVFLAVAVIGGALYYWVASPFLLPMIGSATPQVGGWISTAQSQIEPVITYVKENAQLVGATAGSVTIAGGWIANKLYKHNLVKKEIETTSKINEINSQYFQLDAEKRGLENALEQAQSKIGLLEDGATTVKEITAQLDSKIREVDKLTAERNQLAQLLPNIKSAEQLIKESKQVP